MTSSLRGRSTSRFINRHEAGGDYEGGGGYKLQNKMVAESFYKEVITEIEKREVF